MTRIYSCNQCSLGCWLCLHLDTVQSQRQRGVTSSTATTDSYKRKMAKLSPGPHQPRQAICTHSITTFFLNCSPAHRSASPSPAYDARGQTSRPSPSSPSTFPPASSTHFLCRHIIMLRAVVGQSDFPTASAFFTGANSSVLRTSTSNGDSARLKTSNMNCSSLIP